MPRDGSGNYTLPVENPVVTHTDITTDWANTTMADIAAALTDSLSRHGNGGMLVPFRFADGTVAAPGITFANEPTSGLYRAGLNDFRFAVGAADVMQMTPAGITIPAGKTIIFSPGSTINNVVIGDVTPAAGTFTTVTATAPTNVGTGVHGIKAGSADGLQHSIRIFGDTTANHGPVLSLFRSGAHEYYIAGGPNAIQIGVAGAAGLADYNDATLSAGATVGISATNVNITGTMVVSGLFSASAAGIDAGAGTLNLNTVGAGFLDVAGTALYKWDAAKFSPNNTQDNLLDLGNASFRWKTGYFGTGGLFSTGDVSTAGHIVLTGSLGGLGGATRYIGTGGSASILYYNVPTGGVHNFAVNETVVGAFTNTGLTVTGSLNATVSIQGLQPRFEQAGISLAPNTEGAFSLPAGMARPKLVIAVYRCLTADQGYVAGDEVHPADFYFDNPNYVGLGTWVSATQIGWAIGAQGCTFMHKTNNVGVGPTNLAYWEIVLRAW